jgi:diguanylate cyclase (GGDEF)-like protein
VLSCDLDDFKAANERHGHAWGDRALVETVERLRSELGPEPFLARPDSDEFIIVVHPAQDDVAQRALAHRLRDAVTRSGEGVAAPGLTIGVALWSPGDPVDPAALVRQADRAVIEAKRSRLGVVVCDSVLRTHVAERTALRRALESGLEDGEIVAHFQPLSDAWTLEVVGLEALARWRRDGRLRPPAEWLPFAEETGLIVEVGRQMLRAARQGMERFGLPVAVNVAARQLDEPDFVAQVERCWGQDGWDQLTIEVTESALLHDAAHVRGSLAALAERGVKIAIDDFGTGYNSLSRLGTLPLHILKIDRSFVQDFASAEGAAVLRAIIALAEAHGLEIVAEGVERTEELTALIGMGVTTVQGYMLGRPAAGLPLQGARTQWATVRPAVSV